MGFEALGSDTLGAVLDEVIAAHPDEWARFVEGDDKLMGFFTGAVMKATSGKANGKEVAAELRQPPRLTRRGASPARPRSLGPAVTPGPQRRGARRHDPARRADEVQLLIGVPGHGPSTAVHHMMVMQAHEREVVEVGRGRPGSHGTM